MVTTKWVSQQVTQAQDYASCSRTSAACGILPDMSWKRVCRGSLVTSVLVNLRGHRDGAAVPGPQTLIHLQGRIPNTPGKQCPEGLPRCGKEGSSAHQADDLHHLQSRQVSRTALDKTYLKGFRLHEIENLHVTLPEGINPIQTKYLNSTKKNHSYKWNEQLRPGWIMVKIAQLPLPQQLPLLGQQGQSQSQ